MGWHGVSVSYLAGHVLTAVADRGIGLDWETVGQPPALPDPAAQVADAVARLTGEEPTVAMTRVWTALEALVKVGAAVDAPLALRDETGPDGWVALRAGRHLVVSTVLPTTAGQIAVSLAVADVDGES